MALQGGHHLKSNKKILCVELGNDRLLSESEIVKFALLGDETDLL